MSSIKRLIYGLFIGLLLLNFSSLSAKELERQAKVIFLKADVRIQKAGKTDWTRAKRGMNLADGDTAKTGKDSALELSFDSENKNIIRLEENSTAILRGKMLTQIELPQGRVRSLIKSLKKESSFEIKTPTIIAGARGSGWDVIAEAKRDTVKAFEDEIFVRSFDDQGKLIKEVYVREGWEVFIERFQAPSELVELSDADRKDWGFWKDDLNRRLSPSKTEGTDKTISNFENIQAIEQATQKEQEYKQDLFETQDIKRVEDRANVEQRSANTSQPTLRK